MSRFATMAATRLAPASVDVQAGGRLVRIDRHLSEYFLVQTLWVLFKSRFTHWQRRRNGAFETRDILDAWQHLPANVVRPGRNKRQHLSSVLARNEIDRDYAYNRALFMRLALWPARRRRGLPRDNSPPVGHPRGKTGGNRTRQAGNRRAQEALIGAR